MRHAGRSSRLSQREVRRWQRTTGRALGLLAGLILSQATGVVAPAQAAENPLLDGRDGAHPLDLARASLVGRDGRFELSIDTHEKFDGALLSTSTGRSLCLVLRYGNLSTPRARICALPIPGQKRLSLRYTRLDPFGHPYRVRPLRARVSRPNGRQLRASFSAADAGLNPGQEFTWQIVSTWSGDAACPTPGTAGCTDVLPDGQPRRAQVVMRPIGCLAAGRVERRRRSGAGSRKIALTFDDGPGAYTPAVLRALDRAKVPGTFFVVGRQVIGKATLLRRMLRDGHMIANHSLTHAKLGGGGRRAAGEIRSTQRLIRRATGFTPCLFRPPYGSTSTALNAVVRANGLLSILWDVDPRDWTTPGAHVISSRIIGQGRPGSIVLLHDAGGRRGQTVAALPRIIRNFKARGYRFVTADQLLGLDLRYR